MKLKIKKLNLSLIGLLQALGVVAYCVLVVALITSLGKVFIEPPNFFVSVAMLALLVFSAAVTGSIVFGFSAYLALNNRIKEALIILAYTLLYSFGIIMIILVLLAVM